MKALFLAGALALAVSAQSARAAMTEEEFSGMADGLGQSCKAMVAIADGKVRGPNANLQTLNGIGEWLASLPYGWNQFQAIGLVVGECRRHPDFTVSWAVDRLLSDNRSHNLPATK